MRIQTPFCPSTPVVLRSLDHHDMQATWEGKKWSPAYDIPDNPATSDRLSSRLALSCFREYSQYVSRLLSVYRPACCVIHVTQ
jgi:hypothetical protein